jgi:hypothetical protein
MVAKGQKLKRKKPLTELYQAIDKAHQRLVEKGSFKRFKFGRRIGRR